MRVLGIDPGPVTSHWAIYDGDTIKAGSFNNDKYRTKEQPSYPYGDDWAGSTWTVVAIEKIAGYGMAVGAEVFETVWWTGRMFEWYDGRFTDQTVLRPTRKEIKIHCCESLQAKDKNIRQALIDRFGPPGTKKNPGKTYGIVKDQWQALAVAVYAYDKLHKKDVR